MVSFASSAAALLIAGIANVETQSVPAQRRSGSASGQAAPQRRPRRQAVVVATASPATTRG
jgi:hypothetical protein